MSKKTIVLFFLAVIGLAVACGKGRTAGSVAMEAVSLDSLERRNVSLRPVVEPGDYDADGCVRGQAMPMLTDSTPFIMSNYSFVRTAPAVSYEMCRYADNTVLEISNSGCEYFSFSFGWSYNGVSPDIADSAVVSRSIADTRDAGRWCGAFADEIVSAADTLERHIREVGLKAAAGRMFDFMPANGGFRYVVSVDSVRRFSDAACVRIAFSFGPL